MAKTLSFATCSLLNFKVFKEYNHVNLQLKHVKTGCRAKSIKLQRVLIANDLEFAHFRERSEFTAWGAEVFRGPSFIFTYSQGGPLFMACQGGLVLF